MTACGTPIASCPSHTNVYTSSVNVCHDTYTHVYIGLFSVYTGLFPVHTGLFSVYIGLFPVHTGLLSVYIGLFSVHTGLFSVHIGLFSVYVCHVDICCMHDVIYIYI